MTITVYGSPAPQGSKSFKGISKAGHGIMIESSKAVKPWRQDVRAAAIEAVTEFAASHDMLGSAKDLRYVGPIEVRMTFTLPKPKSAPKRRRTYPDRTPDLSKLVRSTEDALTQAGVWEDDARIVKCTASKVYPGEGTDALHIPGAVIHIRQVSE